ncbi:iron-sulfur cluster biosynthesis family protein [Paenibacillus sp. URB8-2]|uniref:iron-sulfur cluster biosynthesis family protein n=1 Tax=Paenibacillus sp. URB8-2 TaxID=2741301 RepID=UPI0015BE354D|nr:iron-sulfur cluster biosynthesis family protein [Paenibacillus sp. URB8-2]
MKIQLTPLAEKRLKERLGSQPGTFKLFYDTVDCGCDGINVLLIQDKPDTGDLHVEAGDLPVVVGNQHEIFYEEQLKLDADENTSSFKLSSDSQLYGQNILVRDMRGLNGVEPVQASACEVRTRT